MALELKSIPDDDVDAFHDMVKDPTLSINTGSIPHPVDREWSMERLKVRRQEETDGKRVDCGLYDDGVLVGIAGWFYNDQGEMEIGYAIHRDHRGKGLATRAAAMVLKMLDESGYEGPVYAQYFKDNAASGRVLEKLGFKRERSTEGVSPARGGTAPAWIMKLDV